jgi:hypothetical protein
LKIYVSFVPFVASWNFVVAEGETVGTSRDSSTGHGGAPRLTKGLEGSKDTKLKMYVSFVPFVASWSFAKAEGETVGTSHKGQ